MQSLEKFEQSVYIDECIMTFCSFFDDHLKRFSNVFIFTQDNSHIMLHPVLRTPNERTKQWGSMQPFPNFMVNPHSTSLSKI